jgi:hypothetical protein
VTGRHRATDMLAAEEGVVWLWLRRAVAAVLVRMAK